MTDVAVCVSLTDETPTIPRAGVSELISFENTVVELRLERPRTIDDRVVYVPFDDVASLQRALERVTENPAAISQVVSSGDILGTKTIDSVRLSRYYPSNVGRNRVCASCGETMYEGGHDGVIQQYNGRTDRPNKNMGIGFHATCAADISSQFTPLWDRADDVLAQVL